ncbi:hypothetical protein [Nostoc sp. S13]|uniref:hypothetical protein n=1 Tax=Nostoc sp. S13 TaxID=3019266 RepID=UPI0026061BFA|nr:hypothetical protein [Nostoc sp. S13]MDF5734755.1 hypothetical protein [Nostoc sp. S13]
MPRDTKPTPTQVIPRDTTPTLTPVIPRDTTPTLTPVIPRDTTPTLTPVIPQNTTPTLTPTPTTIPTPTPVIPRNTTQDETMPTGNYIGVGGNFGLSGDTALGESAFTIFSKIGLRNNFSFRPAATISDKTVFLIPVTIDFPVESITDLGESQIIAVPYIGGGAAISTNEDTSVGFLLTGGVDVRVSPEFTATAGLNVDFLDTTDIGLLLGIGYNF